MVQENIRSQLERRVRTRSFLTPKPSKRRVFMILECNNTLFGAFGPVVAHCYSPVGLPFY